MAEIIRFPLSISERRKAHLANQRGLSKGQFNENLKTQDDNVRNTGGYVLDEQDIRFIETCKSGRIKPSDITGQDPRAILARRIIKDLNTQGRLERIDE